MKILDILKDRRGTSGKEAAMRLERSFIMDKTNIAPDKLEIITQDLVRTLKKHVGIEERDIRVIIRMRNSLEGVGAIPYMEVAVPIYPREVEG